jgi:4-coumarate--CoA ligase
MSGGNDNNKFIFYGGPEPDNIGDGCRSIGEFFLKQMTQHGDKVALISGVTGEEVTFHQLKIRVIRLARALRAAGVGHNDVIGLVSENRIEFPVTLFAILLCGATAATVNLTYSDRKFSTIFNLMLHDLVLITFQLYLFLK